MIRRAVGCKEGLLVMSVRFQVEVDLGAKVGEKFVFVWLEGSSR